MVSNSNQYNPTQESDPRVTKNFMKVFLFPTKSAIPESSGEMKATTKKAQPVTKLIMAVFFTS